MSRKTVGRQRNCPDGKIERFIEPCLLLLLAENPSHGYELMENLSQFNFDPRCQDPGQVYRTLRRMEKEDLVHSVWETGQSGPARRRYEITGDGMDVLHAWMQTLENRIRMVQKLIGKYKNITDRK